MVVNNYNLPELDISFKVLVGVGYESNLDHVEKVTKEEILKVMNEIEGGVKDAEPVIRCYEFSDSSIQLKAFLRVKAYPYQFAMAHEFIKRLHKRYKVEDIHIPFPIRTIYQPDNQSRHCR